MTEFGLTEQSRLAEFLGIQERDCGCKEMGLGPTRFCSRCKGSGRTTDLTPAGLALIEACRKRGVLISVDTFSEGYEVECFQGGRFVFRVDCQFTDLESTIAIAALKGLEEREEQENQQQGKK